MEDLSRPFAAAANVREEARLLFEAARSAVISWNTLDPAGRLQFRLLRAHQPATSWFDYAEWHRTGRHSFSAQSDGEGVSVDVDVINARQPFDGIDVRAEGIAFALVAAATPVSPAPSLPYARDAFVLDVPARSQYVVDGQRAWCSPASLSMINAYHGIDVDVESTAAAVMDSAYNGTGNWAFNAAFSGHLGLRAVVAYLRNLDHAQRLIERGLPVALSYSWSGDELPGAPLEHSDGHLAVLCGFARNGDCVVNDPAAPGLRVVYPRAAMEAVWQRAGGISYVVAPGGKEPFDVLASPL